MTLPIGCIALFLGTASAAFAATTGYVATPIGSLGGVSTDGTAIDASGQVAGFADTDSAGAIHRHAFLYTGGALINLGTLAGGAQSFAQGSNDAGQVVGSSSAGGVSGMHAVLFSGSNLTDINAQLGAQSSNAYGINNRGDIVGGRSLDGVTRAYRRLASGGVVDLGTFGGTASQAYAINDFGSVTGFAHTPSSDAHAFRFDDARGLVDLGTLGGPNSVGYGIAATGEVVGLTFLTGAAGPHAFIHDGTAMFDLGTLGGRSSTARAINAAETIVGESLDAQDFSRAFVYVDGAMIDLNGVTMGLNGARLTIATAINDSGQIVAMSCTALLVCQQAFRLDPVAAAKVVAVEYHHAQFDHYFITAIADEITKLDNGTFAGWARTGEAFNVYATNQIGTKPVCRFFSTAFPPKSSHFYTPSSTECATVKQNANWQFEGFVFNVAVPDANGNCAVSTQPVYRLYNNGMGAAPNHRYTTSLSTRAAMIAQGWIPEGNGPSAVGMCAAL